MRVLLALTYYRPYVSGLTIYVERLARGLAARGHDVTVLASRHDPDLPRAEEAGGVRIVRVPVALHVSKGVVMPSYGFEATRQVRAHDVLSIHLPQLDAWGLALRGRILRRPAVVTYHCDLALPRGLVNAVAQRAIALANEVTLTAAHRVVAYTREYAEHSRPLRRHADKVEVIGPPIVMPRASRAHVAQFAREQGLAAAGSSGRRVVGMAARLAAEKGVDTLLAAAPALLERFPDTVFAFAGQHEDVLGEAEYRRRLAPAFGALGDRWRFLGPLDPVREMSAFLGTLDCLVVPSVNSTESFGLVQAEAMLCGTPVVASDLPGVRQPVLRTGMGEIVPPGDHRALAAAISRVLERPDAYARPHGEIAAQFDPERTVAAYEELFARELARAARAPRPASART